MKKIVLFIVLAMVLFSCKSFMMKDGGNFAIQNNSDKEVEYVWITPEGEFWPTTRSINLKNAELYEIKGLKPGVYDIAIDFKGEYEQEFYNSKKDKSKCLVVEKGITQVWIIDQSGEIVKE